jgi:hypothetical protein
MSAIAQALTDKDFLTAQPDDQKAYLAHIDPDFAKASPEDQAAYHAAVVLPAVKQNSLKLNAQPTQFEKQNSQGTLAKVGREAALGAASGYTGMPESVHPLQDFGKQMQQQAEQVQAHPIREGLKAVALGPAPQLYQMGKGLLESGGEMGSGAIHGDPEQIAHGAGRLAGQAAQVATMKEAPETADKPSSVLMPAIKKVGEPFHIGMSGEDLLKKGVSPRAQATGWDDAMARPGVQRAIQESHAASPIKSAADLDEAIPQMKDKIWSEKVDPALERQAKRPVDMKPAADAVRKQITPEVKEFDEGHAKELDSLAEKLEGSRDIEGANRLLKYVNGKLESYFSKYPSARRANLANNPDVAGWESARRAIRDQFLDTLEKAGETQVRDARQDYGGLETIGKEVERRVNVADRSKPWSLSRILGWSSAPMTGPIGPIMGEVATHLNKPDVMIRRGVGRLKPEAETPFTPPKPFTPTQGSSLPQTVTAQGPQRIGVKQVGAANDRPQVKYIPSEKADVMGQPAQDLGRQFNEDEITHERNKANSIVKSKTATAEEKKEAQLRLDESYGEDRSTGDEGLVPSKLTQQRTARERASKMRSGRP